MLLQQTINLDRKDRVEDRPPQGEYDFLEAGVTGLTRRCTELCILGNFPYHVVMQDTGYSRINRIGVWYPRHVLEEARATWQQPRKPPAKPEKRDWHNDPPTQPQLEYLAALEYTGPTPSTKLEARDLIDEYKEKRFARQVAEQVRRTFRPEEYNDVNDPTRPR